jgi:CheY-like chemotaxis protein
MCLNKHASRNREITKGEEVMPVALVVEDDEFIRMLFREALQGAGFSVILAGGVKEALGILEKQVPDVVFIDYNLPERPGTDVLTYIKTTPHLSKTKTIVVTAQTQAQNKAEELGADLFLIKPVSIEEMTRLASRLIN